MNVALPAGEPAVRTQTDRVHRRLRADIIAGRLAPGTRLAMEQLKTAYGVGLSPLREALSRLSSQGLVEQLSQRGFRVAGVSRADLRDIWDMRLRLESEALERSIKEGDSDWRNACRAAHDSLADFYADRPVTPDNHEIWEERHRAFHMQLLAACPSRWLLRFCAQLYDQFDRYRRLAGLDRGFYRGMVDEHRDLLEAALEGSQEDAVLILRRHIRRTTETVEARLSAPDTLAATEDVRASTR